MSNIYSFPDEVKDKLKGAYYSAKNKIENLFTGGSSAEKGLSTTPPTGSTGATTQKVPDAVIKENPALPSIPTSGGDKSQVQKQALDQVMNSGKFDMNDPTQKEQAFITAKQLSDEMMAGFSQFSTEARKNSGVDTLTSMRDEATANYFKMVNSIGSGQAIAEIEKKVDYTSDIDKTIEALKTKKATVAQDVFKRMQDNAGGTPVNYLEAERVINSQENLLDSQITNLQKVRDSRKQTVLDYAKNIEDDRTKQLENSKSMIEFYDKKVKEAQDAVKEGKADYKWLVDAQQKLQDAQRDYEFKARDMNIKEGELKLKFAETFGQVGDQTSGTAEYIDKVGKTDGENGGQCGSYANKQIGVPGLFGDSFEQKKSVTNSTVPTPGSAFVMNTGTQYGHVGIVTKVLGNGQIEVRDSNFNNDETVRTHVVSTKNIVGYYDPNKARNLNQSVRDDMSQRIDTLKDKGVSMDTIRTMLKPIYGKAYEGVLADVLTEKYSLPDSDYVKSQNFFENLLNMSTMGRSQEELNSEIKDMLAQNPSVVKELKLNTAGPQETQQVLAGVLVDKYIQETGGRFSGTDEQHKQNAQVLAKLKTLFPSISDDSWKELLTEKGITSSLYGYIPFVDDEEDKLFREAGEYLKGAK